MVHVFVLQMVDKIAGAAGRAVVAEQARAAKRRRAIAA